METLKVSAQSDASATAGALANTIRESGEAELQGIGPKAINQAVKAIAIARSYLASSGVDLISMPSFVDVEIDGEQRTALRFSITPRHRLHRPHEDGHSGGGEEPAYREERDEASEADEAWAPDVEASEEADAEEGLRSRPTSLSEAITGRPASELSESTEERTSSEASEDEPESHSNEEAKTERRSSFFGRPRRSGFDTDRDVS